MSVRAIRAAMIAGIAFPLLLFAGAATMFASTPNTSNRSTDEVAQKWVAWLADSGNRTSTIVGAFLLVLAAIALVWFAAGLRARIAAGSPMIGFAVLAASGLAIAMAGPLALTGGHNFGDDPLLTNGQVIGAVYSLAFPALLVVFGMSAAAFIATVCLTGRAVLPMWLVVFGWIAVAAGVVGVLFMPLLIVLLWFLAAAIYGVVRSGQPVERPLDS